jgi:hypothetical protein
MLYIFQAVFPPIIRSSKNVNTASGTCQACLLLPLAWVSPTLAVVARNVYLFYNFKFGHPPWIPYTSLPFFLSMVKLTLLTFISAMLFIFFFISCFFLTLIICYQPDFGIGSAPIYVSWCVFIASNSAAKRSPRNTFEFFFSIFKPVYDM